MVELAAMGLDEQETRLAMPLVAFACTALAEKSPDNRGTLVSCVNRL